MSIILPTPAPGAPSVTATTNVNIRTGPGTQYPRIGILPAGQSAEVIGVSSDNAWWAIKVPPEAIKVSYLNTDDASLRLSAFARSKVKPRPVNAYSGNGWVSAKYVTAQSTDNVPVIQPPPVPTATPVPPVDFTGWQGEYFNNRELQGNPVLVRDDPKITFNWGVGSPGPEVPVDNFSARWTISRDVPEGIYRFSIWADNGVRLWIDDGLVINGWVEGPPRNFYTRVKLNQGTHRVRVEYFHAAGEAMIELEVGYDKEEPQPQPPKAAINGTTQAQVGQPVFFNARNSQVAEGSHIKTFEWDFGDGSTATGVDVSHVYGETGTYEVQLKVTDDKDLSNTATHQINIVEGPVTPEPTNTPAPGKPVAAISGSAEASVGQKVSFDASASQCEGGCQSYLWAFGDGDAANAVTVDHTYRQAGEFFVKLVVTDGNNTSSDEATHRIVVTEEEPAPTDVPTLAPTEAPPPQPTEEPQPPTAVIDGPPTAEVGVPVTFSCQDSDPGEGGNRIGQCLWNFGDGTAGQPGSPTVSYTYQQASGEIGYTVTLTVTNEKGLEDTTSLTIMVMAGPAIE